MFEINIFSRWAVNVAEIKVEFIFVTNETMNEIDDRQWQPRLPSCHIASAECFQLSDADEYLQN